MRGRYAPISDDTGIIGWMYLCPLCDHWTAFTTCEGGCCECGFTEPYVDPDDWYDAWLLDRNKKEDKWT